jgi:hypothetical protein
MCGGGRVRLGLRLGLIYARKRVFVCALIVGRLLFSSPKCSIEYLAIILEFIVYTHCSIHVLVALGPEA